jgi:flagellar hook-associated protein 2
MRAGKDPGRAVPGTGAALCGRIVIDNDPTSVPLPEWKPPEPPARIDDMGAFSLVFSDGSSVELNPLEDSLDFTSVQYQIPDTELGKTIVGLAVANKNTHRDIAIQHIRLIDPNDPGALKPKNPVSVAQDAVISMDGVTISRPKNVIDDILPGVTLTVKKAAEKPVRLEIGADKESIKNSIISFVGNYNRLMAEINVLTRNDDRIIQELSYLSAEEQDELRKRMGAFSSDSTLIQFKNALQNAASAPYPIASGVAMLAKFGIGTDMRMSGAGYDPSRLRGYLEIDEKKLDDALSLNLIDMQQLFGYDTNGDMIVDSGIAYSFENLSKPYVETGGVIALKIATIDSKIKADTKRIGDLDKQLANKEATLKAQYSQMESAYNRMEQMSNSLDNFSKQNSNGR